MNYTFNVGEFTKQHAESDDFLNKEVKITVCADGMTHVYSGILSPFDETTTKVGKHTLYNEDIVKIYVKPVEQVKSAEVALKAYKKETCPKRELKECFNDLLADLMHFADENQIDFEESLANARNHYETER